MPTHAQRRADSHDRIIAAASRLFRERGYHHASVADIMAEAHLTVGGFYAHFANKEDLFDAAMQHAMVQSFAQLETHLADSAGWERVAALAHAYLSPAHFALIDQGCPAPSLLSEIARGPAAVRRTFTKLSRERTDRIAEFFAPAERAAVWPILHAIGCMAVGAMSFARASKEPAYVKATLEGARQAIALLIATVKATPLQNAPADSAPPSTPPHA